MATIYSWRPPSSIHHDGTLPDFSPSRSGQRSRDAIPKGSVASRVQLLQNLRSLEAPKFGDSVKPRVREDSRSGFGRRVNPRFGHPATKSSQPDESPRVESRHSFLGIKTIRTHHEAEHGIADEGFRYERSPGISVQVEQQTDTRKQDDAASQWGISSRAKFNTRGSGSRNGIDLDVLKEVDFSGNQKQYMPQTSFFPSTATKTSGDSCGRQIQPHRSGFKDSQDSVNTIATTSTTRRRDVRDMFDDYGIQRPAGLASREAFHDFGDTPYGHHNYCHLCASSNSRTSVACWRCSHRFCYKCNDQLPSTLEEEHPCPGEELPGKGRNLRPKENRRINDDLVKQAQPRPGPTPLQPRFEQHALPSRKPFRPTLKFSALYEPVTGLETVRGFPSQQDSGISLEQRVPTSVKDNPFVIADLGAPRKSLPFLPKHSREVSHHASHHRVKHQRAINISSEVPSCGSQTSHATDHEYVVSCPRKKPKERVPEETEASHNADPSRINCTVDISARCYSPISGHDPPHHAHHSDSPHSRFTYGSGPDSSHSQIVKTDYGIKHGVPEYVECHGYPRTGHARHGSPISTGVVGECQHCLDDCQCAACQNTHHSVRCCTHADHKTFAHHHHTPRKKAVSLWPGDYALVQVSSSPPAILHERSSQPHHRKSNEPNSKAATEPRLVVNPEHSLDSNNIRSHEKVHSFTSNSSWTEREQFTIQGKNCFPGRISTNFRASTEPTDGTLFTIPSHHELEHNHVRRASCTFLSRDSVAKGRNCATLPANRSPRMGSLPKSRKASRKFSTLFQLNKQNSVQALTKQLLDDQEQSKRIQMGGSSLSSRTAVAQLAQEVEGRGFTTPDNETSMPRIRSIDSKGTTGKRKEWKLKLVDWSPEDKKVAGKEHNLSDDEIVGEEEKSGNFKSQPSVSTTSLDWMDSWEFGADEQGLSTDEVVDKESEREHRCYWKQRYKEVSKNVASGKFDLGIAGITILIHLLGREDLVAKVESWTGGSELKVED